VVTVPEFAEFPEFLEGANRTATVASQLLLATLGGILRR
jgi:hypothetical protein